MIAIVIADDHPIVREGFLRIVEEAADMHVVGEAATGEELLAQLREHEADVVLLDISMPGPDFVDVMTTTRERWPNLKILVVSAHPEEQYAIRSLEAGAAGYLTKERSPEDLVTAIRRVYRGGRYVTPSLAEHLASRFGPEYRGAPHEGLSERERRVVGLLAAGKSVKEIAATLALSPKTVSTYRRRALDRLGLETTADLIRYAIEHDLAD
ncbi:MAG: response regulator transcription factor [Gemmatimonadales bacterium]|jgi:DNA-binding NarL/FixJ family response regulator